MQCAKAPRLRQSAAKGSGAQPRVRRGDSSAEVSLEVRVVADEVTRIPLLGDHHRVAVTRSLELVLTAQRELLRVRPTARAPVTCRSQPRSTTPARRPWRVRHAPRTRGHAQASRRRKSLKCRLSRTPLAMRHLGPIVTRDTSSDPPPGPSVEVVCAHGVSCPSCAHVISTQPAPRAPGEHAGTPQKAQVTRCLDLTESQAIRRHVIANRAELRKGTCGSVWADPR